MKLTNEDVDEILQLIDGSAFDEMHLQTGSFKLSLRRSGVDGWTQSTQTVVEATLVETAIAASTSATAPAAARAHDSSPDLVDVRSPLPGTLMRGVCSPTKEFSVTIVTPLLGPTISHGDRVSNSYG